jgi:hypothetical protein
MIAARDQVVLSVQRSDISMKNSALSRSFLVGALLFGFAIPTRAQAQDVQKIHIEIQTPRDGGPSFTVTNLADKALSACALEVSVASEAKKVSTMIWDAPFLGVHPLEPQANLTMPLPHVVGDVFPDKVVVVAGIWEDGETFGDADWLKNILQSRKSMASMYDRAAYFLQLGLRENWDRPTFLEKLKLSMPNSGDNAGIRSTLEGNPQLDGNPKALQQIIRTLLENIKQKSDRLSQAKPATDMLGRPLPPP